jgi:hypothetical protein
MGGVKPGAGMNLQSTMMQQQLILQVPAAISSVYVLAPPSHTQIHKLCCTLANIQLPL